jgi:arsenate reductase (thioredoxin)
VTAHWGIRDPAAATGTEAVVRLAFAEALRWLSSRINIFVSLPLRSLDTLSLQRQLDSIGKTKDAGEQLGGTQAAAAFLDRAIAGLTPSEQV